MFSSNPMRSVMINRLLSSAAIGALAFAAPVCCNVAFAQHVSLGGGYERSGEIRHVLLISIDGMHALDFSNCASEIDGGPVYCPRLAELAKSGLTYTQASTSKPSDCFPD